MDKVINFSKKMIATLKNGCNVAVDATCGRGGDTEFLASIANHVYAFDIQEEAVKSTNERLKMLENVNCDIQVIHDNHLFFPKYIECGIDVVMFNLGYLPNGDKTITTKASSTVKTLKLFMDNLNQKGLISIVVYPGHPEGLKESKALEKYLKEVDQHLFDIVKYDFINQKNYPPYLILIEKL